MSKYELGIGEGVAKILKNGETMCIVDDFIVWELEYMISAANQFWEECKSQVKSQ